MNLQQDCLTACGSSRQQFSWHGAQSEVRCLHHQRSPPQRGYSGQFPLQEKRQVQAHETLRQVHRPPRQVHGRACHSRLREVQREEVRLHAKAQRCLMMSQPSNEEVSREYPLHQKRRCFPFEECVLVHRLSAPAQF